MPVHFMNVRILSFMTNNPCVKDLNIISHIYMEASDSSIGRADDCSCLVVIIRSLVRFRLGGHF